MARQSSSHTIVEELTGILLFLGVIWAVFALSFFLPLTDYGLRPRSFFGLLGIVTMPFLHAGWGHILSNSVPLFLLLCLLAGSRARSWEIVIVIVLVNGTLLWLFGRNATHVGASGLVFGLIAFLIFAGFLERRAKSLIIALITLALYGGTLVLGSLPTVNRHISWEGHLFGAIAGGFVAYMLVTHGDEPHSDRGL